MLPEPEPEFEATGMDYEHESTMMERFCKQKNQALFTIGVLFLVVTAFKMVFKRMDQQKERRRAAYREEQKREADKQNG